MSIETVGGESRVTRAFREATVQVVASEAA